MSMHPAAPLPSLQSQPYAAPLTGKRRSVWLRGMLAGLGAALVAAALAGIADDQPVCLLLVALVAVGLAYDSDGRTWAKRVAVAVLTTVVLVALCCAAAIALLVVALSSGTIG